MPPYLGILKPKSPQVGDFSGPGGIRTRGLFSAIEVDWLSTESSTYIWWYYLPHLPTCGGISVQDVLIFHTVLPALQPVAAGTRIPGMKRGEQV